MALQTITVGNVVDDGSGDYLRKGGLKINSNFSDVYNELGDTVNLHAAGAWKVHRFGIVTSDSPGTNLTVSFGQAWAIDTGGGIVNIALPKGTVADIGKVIRLRDTYGTWATNVVRCTAQSGDTIKGKAGTTELKRQYADIELVYTSGGRWEYASQKLVNNISFSDVPSVVRKSILAVAGQRDFDFEALLDGEYNISAFEMFRRGNLLYYGDVLDINADYGSIPDPDTLLYTNATAYVKGTIVKVVNANNALATTNPLYEFWTHNYFVAKNTFTSGSSFNAALWTQINSQDLVPPDGKTIRLRAPANVNDPIAIVTYLTDVSSFRTSYNKRSIKIIGTGNVTENATAGQSIKIDIQNDLTLSLEDFGYAEYEQYNPEALEIEINGTQLVRASQAGTSSFTSGSGEFEFDTGQDSSDRWNQIHFGSPLSDGDIVTVRWFDSIIGTILSWDEGDDNVQLRSDERYLQTLQTFTRKNKISYADTTAPSAQTTTIVSDPETDIRFDEVTSLLESIYPIGSIYINANNPSNPHDYMGFGTWVRYAEGKALVGWEDADSSGAYDAQFSYNNQWLVDGLPQVAAGGIGGAKAVVLTAANIPELASGLTDGSTRNEESTSEQYALVARPSSGDVNLNGCQLDPDAGTVSLGFYKEEPIKVNTGVTPTGANILQPYITAHVWVRTE